MYSFPYNNLQNKPEDILVLEFNLNNRVPAKVGDEKLFHTACIMKKVAILRGLNFFDVIFRSSVRMDTEFTSDFYFDFCRMSNVLDQNKCTNFILDLYQTKAYSPYKERNPKTSFAGSWAKQTVSSNQKPFVLKILYDSNSTKSLLVCQTESKKMTKNSSKVELCKKRGSTNE